MYLSSSSSKDSDRIQLIQAINNFTIKGEQLMESMKSFDTFREQIAKLDIQINAKKQEYDEMELNANASHTQKMKKLEAEYNDLNQTLQSKYTVANKKLESEYEDKSRKLTNDFKNSQIEIKQKLAEFKLKACEELAKENSMVVIKSDDLNTLQQSVTKSNTELETLRKAYDKDIDKVRQEEKTKYTTQLDNEKKILQLNANVTNAEMKAQIDQQVKEIQVLKSQIENLKHELSEQRALTKEVAQASAKAQITQSFAK
jgi:chromosome segregation ATPase